MSRILTVLFLAGLSWCSAAWASQTHTQTFRRWTVQFPYPDEYQAQPLSGLKLPDVGQQFLDPPHRLVVLALAPREKETGALEAALPQLVEPYLPNAAFVPLAPPSDLPQGSRAASRLCTFADPQRNDVLRPCLILAVERQEGWFVFLASGHELSQTDPFSRSLARMAREMELRPRRGGWFGSAGVPAPAPSPQTDSIQSPPSPGSRSEVTPDGSPSGSQAVSTPVPPDTGAASLNLRPEEDQPARIVSSATGTDRFVWGAFQAQSSRLEAVPFEILWHHQQQTYTEVCAATDSHGCVYTSVCENDRGYERDRIFVFPQRSATRGYGKVNSASIMKVLHKQTGNSEISFFAFDSLDSDSQNNLYFTVDLYFHRQPAIMAYLAKQDVYEIIATPDQIDHITEGYSMVDLRFVPGRPDEAWFFIRGKIFRMRRHSPGRWASWPLQIRVRDGGDLDPPSWRQVMDGAPDLNGSWLFFTGQALWRMNAAGEVSPLGRIQLPNADDDVWRTYPVVLPNGDIWLAINRKYSFSGYGTYDQYSGTYDERQTYFLVGDRSRWIRNSPRPQPAFDEGERNQLGRPAGSAAPGKSPHERR